MTRDATGDALRRLDDPDTREAVAAGDTAPIDDLDLTEEEQAMVTAAADDFPEVSGFSFDSFIKIGPSTTAFPKVELPSAGPYANAIKYSFKVT